MEPVLTCQKAESVGLILERFVTTEVFTFCSLHLLVTDCRHYNSKWTCCFQNDAARCNNLIEAGGNSGPQATFFDHDIISFDLQVDFKLSVLETDNRFPIPVFVYIFMVGS